VTPKLEMALALGLPVFPCRADNKSPVPPHGFKDAVSEPEGIHRFDWRNRLIGVPTGPASWIDVLDVDPRHGGMNWYEANKSRLPATRVHYTRSGGLHLLFNAAPDLRCSSGKIAPGVDVRADGGYMIWWPAEGLPFEDYPASGLPAWPLWLLRSLMPKPVLHPHQCPSPRSKGFGTTAAGNQILGLVAFVANSKKGERNARTYWAGCRAKEMIATGIVEANSLGEVIVEAAVSSGLPRQEARATVASAMRGGGRG
jgi:Bifunctional DNA primase/polymerase, N-terminal